MVFVYTGHLADHFLCFHHYKESRYYEMATILENGNIATTKV